MKLRDNLSVVQSMAQIQNAMDELDDEYAKLQVKIDKLAANQNRNRDQHRRLRLGYAAMQQPK